MARPSMRLDGGTSMNFLEIIHVDDWSVRPALVQQFLARDQDAFSAKILEHEVGRRSVEIIDGLASSDLLEREVGRRLDADAALHDAFAADDAFDKNFLGRCNWGGRFSRSRGRSGNDGRGRDSVSRGRRDRRWGRNNRLGGGGDNRAGGFWFRPWEK